MRLLAIDVGTGTQDVLLFDSNEELENCPQLVMPSPTAIVAQRVRAATAAGSPVVLTGVTMGGGPCHWAAMDHVRAGHAVYATPDAARTFDDDLASVARMGIRLVSDDEARTIQGAVQVELRDLYYDEILAALRGFGVEGPPDALALAVFDHGNAPPGYSDRVFRFDYLAAKVGEGLAAFAYDRAEVPPALTRLAAAATTAPVDVPVLLMDTGPAAVLGALDDREVRSAQNVIALNVGNFHCLAFHLRAPTRSQPPATNATVRLSGRLARFAQQKAPAWEILGLFEHHTGEITSAQLERFISRLASGELSNAEIFDSQGHGALVRAGLSTEERAFLAVTGPRRGLIRDSALQPYFAVPHGDMMLTGCFGLLRAYAHRYPEVAELIERRLGPPA
ncbi:MAG: pyruvate formate lyase-activating protein [Chloroflexi bacterium]|nr:pyruvate formate lyase-activating protein [Chloroflexota bacterium]